MSGHMVALRRWISPLAGNLHRIKIMAVDRVWLVGEYPDRVDFGEPLVVSRGMGPAGSDPTVQMASLHAQHGRLDFVETAVPAWLCTDVAARLAMVPESHNSFGNLVAVCKDHSRIAVCAQIFTWVEARRGASAECSQLFAVEACS